MSALFTGLFDDAGLFPPASLPLGAALARHRADADAADAVLTHRFVVPAARLDALVDALGDDRRSIDVSLIVPADTSAEQITALTGRDPRVRVRSIEIGPAAGGETPRAVAQGPLPYGIPVYAEASPGHHRVVLDALGRDGAPAAGIKIRCGGLTQDSFPTAAQLATVIGDAVAAGVPFKATAGLHHALPYTDPGTGLRHHGFLELIALTHGAVGGLRGAALAASVPGPGDLVRWAKGLGPEDAAAVRRSFHSIGSCSTSEPLDDLVHLGLVTR